MQKPPQIPRAFPRSSGSTRATSPTGAADQLRHGQLGSEQWTKHATSSLVRNSESNRDPGSLARNSGLINTPRVRPEQWIIRSRPTNRVAILTNVEHRRAMLSLFCIITFFCTRMQKLPQIPAAFSRTPSRLLPSMPSLFGASLPFLLAHAKAATNPRSISPAYEMKFPRSKPDYFF